MYVHKNGIVLKKLQEHQLPLLMDLKNESWFGTHNIVFVNELDQRRWFESLSSNSSLILVAHLDDVPVGLYKISNIDWVNRRYDSAHDIFRDHRGKKLSVPVLEAGVDFGFEVLNMHRIDTEVLENNLASFKSALRVGFQQEGVRRSCIHKCNTYLDSVIMGIVRSDWSKLDRVIKYEGVCNQSYVPKNQ